MSTFSSVDYFADSVVSLQIWKRKFFKSENFVCNTYIAITLKRHQMPSQCKVWQDRTWGTCAWCCWRL